MKPLRTEPSLSPPEPSDADLRWEAHEERMATDWEYRAEHMTEADLLREEERRAELSYARRWGKHAAQGGALTAIVLFAVGVLPAWIVGVLT